MFENWRSKLRSQGARLKNAQEQLRRQRNRLSVPVGQCRFVVLDTETTGFHAYGGDEIVSIAMLELHGLQPTGRVYTQFINPNRKIPPESTAIHGIQDSDVQDAPRIDQVIGTVRDFLDDDVVVGHHTAFDIRFLNRAALSTLNQKFINPVVDTMLLYLGFSGRLGHYSLEDVASYCKVEIKNRHTALGDAEATSLIFQHLARRMIGEDQSVSSLIASQEDSDF